MSLSPGSRLGRYEIVRQLGAGAMGEVYLANDPQIERRLAIKTVRLDAQAPADDPLRAQLRLRIEREAKAAGRLVHPHVVTLFDAGEIDGVFFLAFEFVDGPDVAARARRSPPLTTMEIVRIGREAAAGLDAAHRGGIIHRDIKPSNILLTPDGAVKIADFGIATLVGQGTHLTQTGSVIGTPQYLSPEQVQSEMPLDGRSDLFSLGVVLYELLSGRRPFDGPSMAGLLYAIVTREAQPLEELRPSLPPRLSSAVMRLLAKKPEGRFPTAAALGDELAAVERELAAVASAPTAPAALAVDVPPTISVPSSPRRRGRGGFWFAAAAVAVVVLLAGAGVQLRRMLAAPARIPAPAADAVERADTAVTARPEAPPATASVGEVVPPPAPPGREVGEVAADTGAEYQVVGSAVAFRITPRDAAGAIAKVDGLVRGPAESMMTLRPGRHEIEIVAAGFAPARLLVESRPDAAVRNLDVALERE